MDGRWLRPRSSARLSRPLIFVSFCRVLSPPCLPHSNAREGWREANVSIDLVLCTPGHGRHRRSKPTAGEGFGCCRRRLHRPDVLHQHVENGVGRIAQQKQHLTGPPNSLCNPLSSRPSELLPTSQRKRVDRIFAQVLSDPFLIVAQCLSLL